MTLIHFDDTAEAQLIADELRSEFVQIDQRVARVIQDAQDRMALLERKNYELAEAVAELARILERQREDRNMNNYNEEQKLRNVARILYTCGVSV